MTRRMTGRSLLHAVIEEAGYRDRSVLRRVALSVAEGERVLVVGGSGSGKTTLLLAVTGVLSGLLGGFVRGQVALGGADPLSPEGFLRVPRLVGVVLQDPDKQIAMPTPLDEVMFVLENLGWERGEAEARAIRMLEVFGLAAKALEPVESLSGGEKRRLTLAASLVHEPSLLLLDEPTASVDPWGVASVRDFVRRRGEGVLIVEHKARYFLDLVDKVVALKDGSVAGEWSLRDADAEAVADALEAVGADAGEPVVREPPVSPGDVVYRAAGVEARRGGRVIVRADEVEVRRGELVALVGPNGSGKTTLLKALTGLLPGASLEARCDPPPGGRCTFYAPQHPDYMFLHLRVGEEAGKAAGRGGVVDPLSDPMVRRYWDASPYRLSHGQRRWLSLLIALAHPARVYLLDEPTTGLDVGLYRKLRGLIVEALRAGAAVVAATHDVRLVADLASRVYMVRGGRVEEVDRWEAVEELERAWRG